LRESNVNFMRVKESIDDVIQPVEASVNGTKIHHIDTGDPAARPIVLIHGFPFSHEMWSPQIALLRKELRVVAYDVRGHGKSDVGDGQYTLEFFVDDLLGLLDHLRIEKAVLCGLSMGGYIALRAIERIRERCLALVLCDTSSEADSNEAKLRRAASIKAIKHEGVKPFADAFLKSVFAQQIKNADAVLMMKEIVESNSPIAICGTLLALAGRTDTTAALATIRVPTLILVGELDKLTPPVVSQRMHDKISHSELHIVSNAGHLSNLENSKEFNKYLLDFLKWID
jgi:3-oxoadipate enol-lactonase